jgi:WD40 repeat protein/uncharacterized caspase-like protein
MCLIRVTCLLLLLCWATALVPAQRIEVVVQSGHAGEVERIAFTSDGRMLASADGDGTIKLWDLTTFKEIGTIRTDLSASVATPNALEFSADDKSLIVLGTDRSVRVYDVASGRKNTQFEKTGKLLNLGGAALNIEGKLAAQLSETGEIQVVNLNDGKPVFAFSFPDSPETLDFPEIQTFTFSPHGELLAVTGTGGRLAFVSTATGKAMPVIKGGEPSCVAFKPDGQAIAVCEKDPKSGAASIAVRSVPSGRSTKKIPVKTGEVTSLVWSPDSTTLAGIVKTRNEAESQDEYSVRLWNLTSNGAPREIKTKYISSFWSLTDARFSPNGEILAVGAGDVSDGRVHLFDVASSRELTELTRQSSYIDKIGYLKNRQFIIKSEHLRFFDLENIRQLSNQLFAEHAVSASGKRFAAYNTLIRSFEVTDLETGKQIAKLQWDRFNITNSAVVFSPDDRFLLAHANSVFTPAQDDRLMLFDAANGELLFSFPDNAKIVTFKTDGKLLAYATRINEREKIKIWDVERRQPLQTIDVKGSVSALAFDPVRDHLSVASFTTDGVMNHYSLNRFRVSDGQVAMTFADPGVIDAIAYSPDGEFLASESSTTVRVWNAGGKQESVLEGHNALVNSLSFSPDGKTLASGSIDGEVIFWDYKKAQIISRLIVVGESDYIFVTPKNYYFASRRGAAAAVALRNELQAFPFEQFDIRFNRPDLVLKAMGSADTALIQVYAKAYQQRLEQYGLTEDNFSGAVTLPNVYIDTKGIPRVTNKKSLTFKIKAQDSSFALAHVNVYVNDVSVYGSKGLSVAKEATSLERQIDVELSPGNNRVQVSVTNTQGVESLRQTFGVAYEGPAPQPELYVLAIGVSKYADESLDLKYPADDAESIIKLFEDRAAQKEMAMVIQPGNSGLVERSKSFYKVHRLKIVNENAKIENIVAARKFLEQAKTDDQVVVFISGHGLLDENNNYFFATHDINFKEPALRGLPYNALEALLDGLTARRKLLLIDTCHAGELAKGDREKLKITETVKSEDGFIRSLDVTPKDITLKPVPQNFQNSLALVEELFADLRLGNGISVVSASGGLQYAFESSRWSGGVFAYALRLGLGQMEADGDKDGRITSSELRDFVRLKVPELTRQKQKPTYRRESVEFDDRVF